jgi:hypothetical protein
MRAADFGQDESDADPGSNLTISRHDRRFFAARNDRHFSNGHKSLKANVLFDGGLVLERRSPENYILTAGCPSGSGEIDTRTRLLKEDVAMRAVAISRSCLTRKPRTPPMQPERIGTQSVQARRRVAPPA